MTALEIVKKYDPLGYGIIERPYLDQLFNDIYKNKNVHFTVWVKSIDSFKNGVVDEIQIYDDSPFSVSNLLIIDPEEH